jgi:DUF4097 and DUF4098 domain-containing protein YvlB
MHVFETPVSAALRVAIQAGHVELETWETPRVELEVTALRDDDVSRSVVAELQIGSRERADGVTEVFVEQPKRRGRFLSRGPSIGVRARCPAGTAVEASSSSADVAALGRYGDVAIKTASGDTSFESVGGACRISSASGDIQLREAEGAVTLNTASGDVHVGTSTGPLSANLVSGDATVLDARAALSVNTVSGDQVIEASGGGDVRLQSVSGDVRVGVRPGFRLYIDASSVSGDVSSQLDAADEPQGDDSVSQLRVRTVSGDVSIVRALGASV